jgi:chemotaxis protein methyltransferase CheR
MTATPLTTSDFDYISALVREKSAIVLESGKEYLVQSRLQPLAQELGLRDISALVGRLKLGEPVLAMQVVEAMATHETSFFRDIHPFDALRDSVLPELIAARARQRSLRIWSAAASTGQEAYSIAITLRAHFAELANWKVSILATDLSHAVLERAREGRYSQIEINRGLPASMLLEYFERDGAAWRVRPEIRRMVDFRALNLVQPWPALGRLDLIFLRNVLIYFDVATKRAVLANVRKVMAPDGYLFLGSAETTLRYDDAFERVRTPRAAAYRLIQP